MPHFIPQYREIDAMLFTGDNIEEVRQFGGDHITVFHDTSHEPQDFVKVHTNNGTVELMAGHWLIQGPHDFYPCDPQTFDNRWVEQTERAANRIHLLGTDDAYAWAAEFVRAKNEAAWSLGDIDEGLMVGWFANAIESAKSIALDDNRDPEFSGDVPEVLDLEDPDDVEKG